MKWVHEVDASLETYRNTEADRMLVAQMVYRRFHGADAVELTAMLFQPPTNRVVS